MRVVFTYDPGQLGGRSSHLGTATVTTQCNYQQAWRNKSEKKSMYRHKDMGRKRKKKKQTQSNTEIKIKSKRKTMKKYKAKKPPKVKAYTIQLIQPKKIK